MAQAPPYPTQPMIYPATPTAPPYPTQPMAYPAPPSAPPPEGPPPAYATTEVAPGQPQHTTTVVVEQKTVVTEPKKKEKKGMFSSFMKEVDKVGKQLGKEVDYCSKKLGDAVDKNVTTSLMGLFANYNVIQLVPRSTGKTAQILLNAGGHMILDGNGHLDPNLFNSLWTVVNEGSNQVRLHNNNHYLAAIKGCATVVPIVPGVTMGLETKFQLSQINSQFLTLESLSERGKFLAFYSTGQVNLAAKKDLDCHMAIKLVSTANAAQVVHVK